MERVYVSVKKDVGSHGYRSVVLLVFLFVLFVVLSVFMSGLYNDSREDLIEKLRKEREVAELSNSLKQEYAGLTGGRMLALKAREKLGLKKPKEEEVLVLR